VVSKLRLALDDALKNIIAGIEEVARYGTFILLLAAMVCTVLLTIAAVIAFALSFHFGGTLRSICVFVAALVLLFCEYVVWLRVKWYSNYWDKIGDSGTY